MASEQFSLCWDNFHKNMSSGMNSLLENEDLVDVTLAVEGKCLKAHKMVLSVCSPYFKELFKSNPCQHPIVFMKDVSYVAISDLLQFMYQGEVQVSQENLTTFIKTAEALQIKGLTGDGNGTADGETESVPEKPAREEYKPTPRAKRQTISTPAVTPAPSVKRQRLTTGSTESNLSQQSLTKIERAASVSDNPVQFKMEPFDNNQSIDLADDTGDDNFGDDVLDDNTVDDTEDYSMMEGTEGEPQAGTSGEGAGEGQGVRTESIFVGGYSYSISSRTLTKVMLRCSGRKTSGCMAKAYIPVGKSNEHLVVMTGHVHPPNYLLEKRREIGKTLREFAITLPVRPMDVYKSVLSIHPEAKDLLTVANAIRTINKLRKKTKFLRPS